MTTSKAQEAENHPHQQASHALGYGLAAIAAALFSLKAIFIKLAYGVNADLDVMTLLVIRMGIALPFYGIIGVWAVRRFKRKTNGHFENTKLTKNHYLFAAAIGLLGYYLASIFDFTGLQFITAQLERLILFTYPLLVMALGALFFGKHIKLKSILPMMLAYAGIALIFARGTIASGEHLILGSVFVFGAALTFALFQLLAVKQVKILGSVLFTCLAMSCAGFGIILHFIVQSIFQHSFDRLLTQPKEVWLLGGAIALVSTLFPTFLINISLGRIGAQAVAVIGMISPLVTIVLAVTLLGEPCGWVDGAGTGLTLIGIGIFTWHERKPSIETTP